MRADAQISSHRLAAAADDEAGFDSEASSAETAERKTGDDERQLLLRYREGDREAFAALVAEYRAPVYSYLSRCGVDPEDRDDLFQEIFIRIHRAVASYQAHRPAHPWIFTIVANTVRTHLRKRRVRQLVFADAAAKPGASQAADPAPDGERRTAARQTVALVEREIGQLRRVQREVVLLACVEKLALGEVAEILGIPVNTVKTHLRRARLALAGALSRQQGEVAI
ncbi:MAG: RNA polymerase sigma factor [Acidobacteriota bacterium]